MTEENFKGNPDVIIPQLPRLRALFEKTAKKYRPIAGTTLLFYSRWGDVRISKTGDADFSVLVKTPTQGILFDIDINGVRFYDSNLGTPKPFHFTLDQILDELESK